MMLKLAYEIVPFVVDVTREMVSYAECCECFATLLPVKT